MMKSVSCCAMSDVSLCVAVVLGKVRSAVGSAQLLMSQRFQQFRGLCEQNLVSVSIRNIYFLSIIIIIIIIIMQLYILRLMKMVYVNY